MFRLQYMYLALKCNKSMIVDEYTMQTLKVNERQ